MGRLNHLISCCLLIILATSCNDISNDFELPTTDNLKSDVRSVDEILSIAEKAYEAISHDSRSSISLTRQNIVPVLTTQSRTGGEPVIYAVNYGDEQGFALVAASKYVKTPLIGVFEDGDYSASGADENANFRYCLNAAQEYAIAEENIGKAAVDTGFLPITPSEPIIRYFGFT